MTPTLSHTVFSMLGMNEYIIGVPELHPDLDEAQQVIFYTIQPNTPRNNMKSCGTRVLAIEGIIILTKK